MIGGGMSHRGMFRRKVNNEPTPPDDTDLIHWLDASDESTIVYDSGSNISEWRDKSGSGNHCTVIDTSFYPTKLTEGISFAPASLDTSTFVFIPANYPDGFQIMIALQRTGDNELNNLGCFLSRIISGSPTFAYHATNGFTGATDGIGIYDRDSFDTSANSSIFTTDKIIVTISGSGDSGDNYTELDVYVNDSAQGLTLSNKVFGYNEVGGRQNKSSASPNLYNISWIGTYFELLTWNKKLDTIENTEAVSYLSSKWGITL